MPSIYDIKTETAEKLLDVALKYDCLKYYLLGIAGYEITVMDVDGTRIKSASFVMEAIYNKYIKEPEIQIDKQVYDTLSFVISFTRDGSNILMILSEIEYQMLAENESRAPFTMDCSKLLKNIKENIDRNYSLYPKPSDINKDGFIGEFKFHDKLLRESYNSNFFIIER